jgi:glycosyltransferase involved in cell wall biosynthesis
MKILLTNFHVGLGGGHDTYIVAIARALGGRHRIVVAAPENSRLLAHVRALGNVAALPMDFPAKLKDAARMIAAWRKVRALLERERFDVVHVNGSPDHRLLMFALLGMRGPRPRIVWTKHNSNRIKRDLLTKLRAVRATHHVIAVSDSAAQLVQDSVYAHCAVDVIKNGVDTHMFAPASALDAQAARRALPGVSKAGKLVFGTVTGFDDYKGTMHMIAAVAALSPALRDQCAIVVVGTEPDEGQRREIDALGMRSQVDVIGFVEDVKRYIKTFDIGFVLSYAVETVSFACREMMAMGKPVIVSRYSGLPENIDNGKEGWIVPPSDVPALRSALEELIGRRGELGIMGERARARAVREFSSAQFVAETEAVYRQSQSTRS